MSDPTESSSKPISAVAVLTVLVLLSAFYVGVRRAYVLRMPPAAYNEAPEGLPADQAWKATPATRRAYLADLREQQAKQAASYAWVDRKAGVVQVPIDRAMELVVRDASQPAAH